MRRTGLKPSWRFLPLPLITWGVAVKWCKACLSPGTKCSKLLIAWGRREPEGILNQNLSLTHLCTNCCNSSLSLGMFSSIKRDIVKYSTFRVLNLLFYSSRICNALSVCGIFWNNILSALVPWYITINHRAIRSYNNLWEYIRNTCIIYQMGFTETRLCLTDKGYLYMSVPYNHTRKNPLASIHWITIKLLLHKPGTPRSVSMKTIPLMLWLQSWLRQGFQYTLKLEEAKFLRWKWYKGHLNLGQDLDLI